MSVYWQIKAQLLKEKIYFDFENLLKSLCWFWLLGKYWFKWCIWSKISFILNCQLKERTRKPLFLLIISETRIDNLIFLFLVYSSDNFRWVLWRGIIYVLGGKDEGQKIEDSIFSYETKTGWTQINSNLVSARMRHSSLANGIFIINLTLTERLIKRWKARDRTRSSLVQMIPETLMQKACFCQPDSA